MDNRPIEEIENAIPHVDRTAMERSEQAMNQLANVGIKLGGYKLEPALGGTLLDRPIFSSTFDTRASRQS